MATLKRIYKGGKKTAEKKSKPELVSALYRSYGKKVGSTQVRKTARPGRKAKTKILVKRKVSGSKRKFGIDVERAKDITDINKKIRAKIDKARSYGVINKALEESRFLYVLTFSPAWAKDMRGHLLSIRRRAKSNYCTLVGVANKKLKDLNIHHVVFSKLCKR